jgi:dipeptidyl aminopeptidase/acylaminoacyl peptidase
MKSIAFFSIAFCVLAASLSPLAVASGPQPIPVTPPAPQQSAGGRAITIDDHFRLKEVEDPQLSADAKWVAYTVTSTLMKEDKTESRIWMAPFGGGDEIPLTAEGVSSYHPRWSPDGKYIAFLSARNEGKAQIWLLNRGGGEAQRMTDTPQDVEDFTWSPDSHRICLILRDATEEELTAARERHEGKDAADSSDEGGADASAEAATEKSVRKKPKTQKPWVIDRLQFKVDEVGYLDHRRNHLYIYDLAAKSLTQITGGDYDDAQAAWSPDSKQLAFASNRSAEPDRNYDNNIWVVSADNTDKGAHLTQITTNPGEDHDPAWSPDGRWIAYVTQTDPKLMEYATKHLGVSAAAGGGEAKVLTRAFDRGVSDIRFAADSQSIYFIADDDGTQNLARIPVTGGEVTRPIGGRLMLYAYSLAKSGDVAAQITTMDRPSEIFTQPAAGGQQTRVSHVNDALMSELRVAPGEYVHFKSKDGWPVSGYLYKPLDYKPGTKVPTLLRPHGGPVWAYYAEYHADIQLFAANGYAVLLPNPRGSSGYGQKHCQAIFADWGNKDFQDDMALVDYAVEQGIADPDKLGVGGWSYGGISTDFIIAQTTRFKASISGAGEALNTSFFGHDQYQKDYTTELGFPWEHHDLWDKLSPFYRIPKITTPTLFMGGDIDWNVPILGGEQMYQGLRLLGRTTELVVYPGEYHEFKTPSHLKDRLERYLAWYGHYVKGDSAPARPATKPGE